MNDLATIQANIQKQLAASQAALPQDSVDNKIRASNHKFILPDGTESEGPMRAIILDYKWKNQYFASTFNRNNITPPDCTAIGRDANELIPDANSKNVQADSCADCPQSKWGSRGRGKACSNKVVLAVAPTRITPLTQPWILELPPTSIGSFTKYMQSIMGKGQLCFTVATSISFDTSQDYTKLEFGNPEPLDEETLMQAYELAQRAHTALPVDTE